MKRFRMGAALAFSLAVTSAAAGTQRVFTGQAFAPDSDRLLYTEEHVLTGACQGESWVTSEQRVSYRQPDGTLMAEKVIAFAGDDTPGYAIDSLRFEDYRFRRSVELSAVTTASGAPVVVDAAFDLYLRSQWDRLLAGESIEFAFRAVDFADVIRLRVSLVNTTVASDGEARYEFLLEPDLWLARLFVAPVRLSYDARGELRQYQGVTNLLDSDDRYFRARIDYGEMRAAC